MALLNRAVAEGVSAHRQAILLAAITRVARIGLEVDRLVFAARQNVPDEIRNMAAAGNSSNRESDCSGAGRDRPRTADARRRWLDKPPPPREPARDRRWTLSLLASFRSDQCISARRVPRSSRISQPSPIRWLRSPINRSFARCASAAARRGTSEECCSAVGRRSGS